MSQRVKQNGEQRGPHSVFRCRTPESISLRVFRQPRTSRLKKLSAATKNHKTSPPHPVKTSPCLVEFRRVVRQARTRVSRSPARFACLRAERVRSISWVAMASTSFGVDAHTANRSRNATSFQWVVALRNDAGERPTGHCAVGPLVRCDLRVAPTVYDVRQECSSPLPWSALHAAVACCRGG